MSNTTLTGLYVPKVVPLSDRKSGEAINVLLYGESGVGKTHFAATCGDRVLYINTGDGIETLLSPYIRKKYPNINTFLTVDINEELKGRMVTDAIAFDKVGDTIEYMLTHHRDQFDLIFLDDMTSLANFALNKALELNQGTGKSQTLVQAKSGKHLPLPAIQDRGMEMDAIKWFLGSIVPLCRQHSVHFIATAHQRNVYRKGAKATDEPVLTRVMPLFTGKDHFAPSVVPAYFDNVWNLTVQGAADQARRRMYTDRTGIIIAKTRHSGVLNAIEDNPVFTNLLSRIKGDK